MKQMWENFKQKHPNAAKWLLTGGLFLIFSYVVTFIKLLLLMFLPDLFKALVGQVEAGNAQTVIDYRARLEAKLKEVLASTTIDESRILTEAAIFADKVAVDEETVRLRSHLQQMYAMLTGGGAVGRKLDFLLQEMNREANTIGSKCTDVRLARVVVDIKAELEKIREQTQNIE